MARDDAAIAVGALLIVFGLWMLAPWLSIVVGGVGLVACGLLLGGE